MEGNSTQRHTDGTGCCIGRSNVFSLTANQQFYLVAEVIRMLVHSYLEFRMQVLLHSLSSESFILQTYTTELTCKNKFKKSKMLPSGTSIISDWI
jgi:hypothetical protein